nr:response regulator transcription factor [Arthrobacter roseus]
MRVLIADDHAAIRTGLRYILESSGGIDVVGEANDGATAVRQAAALRPDVVLMDVRMPGMDGIAATRSVVADGLAQVLILTTFDVDDYIFGALRAGAAGFLLKTAEPGVLVAAVRSVAAGDAVMAPEAMRRVLDAYVALDRRVAGPSGDGSGVAGVDSGAARGGPPSSGASVLREELTARETEVLVLIAEGLSNRQISGRLQISAATTKTHVSRVLAKLGCASRTQAAIVARQEGLV